MRVAIFIGLVIVAQAIHCLAHAPASVVSLILVPVIALYCVILDLYDLWDSTYEEYKNED